MALKSQQETDPQLDIDEMLAELEQKLDRCKHLYDQYFQGFEKRPPTVLLKDVVRVMHDIDQLDIRRAGPRFRYRSLVQRFNTYRTLWNRTMREMELGIYKPAIAKVMRKLKTEGVDAELFKGIRNVAELERVLEKAVGSGQISKEAGAAAQQAGKGLLGPQKRPPSAEPSPTRMKQIFEEYLASRRANGESFNSLNLQTFSAKLSAQAVEIAKKNGAQTVDYRVVSKGGKTILQAIPKK